jgi:hypothetical protein
MSKHETPLTRRYWDEVGGTLVEEFPAVLRGSGNAQRLIDGVIILGEPKKIAKPSEILIKGKEIIVLQTKANRLGMNLMGQAIVSKQLMEKFEPKSIRSIAICSEGDSVLEQYLAVYGIELVVYG